MILDVVYGLSGVGKSTLCEDVSKINGAFYLDLGKEKDFGDIPMIEVAKNLFLKNNNRDHYITEACLHEYDYRREFICELARFMKVDHLNVFHIHVEDDELEGLTKIRSTKIEKYQSLLKGINSGFSCDVDNIKTTYTIIKEKTLAERLEVISNIKNKITIISCYFHSKDFFDVLIRSVKSFSDKNHSVIIMDNSIEQEIFTCKDYTVIKPEKNMGHGPGLDHLINNYVDTEYTLVMDVDTHILRRGYDIDLMDILQKDPNIGLIIPFRCVEKPIHPGVMFFRTDDFKNKIPIKPIKISTDNYPSIYMDVGQAVPIYLNQLYHKKTFTLNRDKSIYDDARGDTWLLNNKQTFHHFGYGTRFYNKTEIGNFKKEKFDDMKSNMLKQINF